MKSILAVSRLHGSHFLRAGDRVTDDIEFFKLGNLSSNKNDDNIDKQSDERNRMDMCGDKNFDEKYQIDKNDEERVTNDIEVLKPGNWVCRKI